MCGYMNVGVCVCVVGGVTLWVNHLKQTQTNDPPPPFSTSSGHLEVSSITSRLASTNWFFHMEVGCLPREELLAFGLQQ